MRAILLAAAIFFILAGLGLAVLPFMLPVALAFGLTTAQGLVLTLGGFLLLALTHLIHAVEQARAAAIATADALANALPAAPAGESPAPSRLKAPTPSHQDEAVSPPDAKDTGSSNETATSSAPASPAPTTRPDSAQSFYIVRQCIMRGLPARILSDGRIEARLEEGWLRFESEQHLNEYLDALDDMRRKGLL